MNPSLAPSPRSSRVLATPVRFLSVIAAMVVMTLCRHATAQIGVVPFPAPGVGDGQAIQPDQFRQLPRDPLTQSNVLRAVKIIESGEITTGLETLQEILDRESDFFVIAPEKDPYSLFSELDQVIAKHRDDYERLFGPSAAQLLQQARTEQNTFLLEEVVRRYALTTAGAEALSELSRIDRDRGEPGRGARLLERLAQHPSTKDPRSLLTEAARLLAATGQHHRIQTMLLRHPEQFPTEEDRTKFLGTLPPQSITSSADAGIYEWRIPFGNPRQTGSASPAPLIGGEQWQNGIIDEVYDFPSLMVAPDVARHLANEQTKRIDSVEKQIRSVSDQIALPAARPIIVGDLVITSGPGSVKAFNLHTGELEWNGVDLDETFDYLAKQSYSAGEAQDPAREEMQLLFTAVRGWRDLTSSSISSDGQQVYAISNCQLVGTMSPQRMMQNTQRHSLLPQRFNRLTAYELATDGKKRWSIGSPGEDYPLGELEEAREIFFFGAPLPVDGHLYALGEDRGQIQVFEIDPATGGIVWSIPLANAERDLVVDDVRRLSGLMPAYADGLLLCPTAQGGITAINPAERRVVWTHQYADGDPISQNRILMMRVMRPQVQNAEQARRELLNDERWFDSRIMIADDTLIFTPPDSDSLVCLNLWTGEPAWDKTLKRDQLVYAGTIFERQLILVGKSEILALNLQDGTPSWKSPIPIPAPSGRGTRMGDMFLQPLTSGEVGVVDLRTGRLITRIPLDSALSTGNLIASTGTVVIETSTGLTGFTSRAQLEERLAQDLKQSETNPEALAERGMWRLQQGDLEAGLADLKSSIKRVQQNPPRIVLGWSLLEGLRTDFAHYRSESDFIESLCSTPSQRQQFLRTYAYGLQRAGETQLAFQKYLELLNALPRSESLRGVDSQWAVTDSRWVLARLDELLSTSTEGTRQQLRTLLTDWVRNSSDVTLLMNVLPAIPTEWTDAEVILQKLASTDEMESNTHEREGILRSLFANGTPSIRMQAAAQLLKIAIRFKDATTIQEMLAELESADLPLPGNADNTSGGLARATRQLPEVADLLHSGINWPTPVHVVENPQNQMRLSISQIPVLGAASPFLRGWSFFIDGSGQHIEIYDQYGQRRHRVSTSYGGTRYAVEADLGRYVTLHNHLAMVVLQDRFFIIDLLTDPAVAKVLVMRETSKRIDNIFFGRNTMVRVPRMGTRSLLLEQNNGNLSGNIGPLSDSILCYEVDESLVAINPLTGAELWRRRDFPAGAEILGDNEYIIAKPADGNTVTIYRAMDGGFVKNAKIPIGVLDCLQRRYGDWGRTLPVIQNKNDNFHFELFDPVREQAVWKYSGPVGTRWTVVSEEKFAFLTPDRRLSIRNGRTGKEIFTASLSAESATGNLSLLEYPDQWIVLMNQSEESAGNDYLPRTYRLAMNRVSGAVTSLDKKTGKVQWTRQVQNMDVLAIGPDEWPLLIFADLVGSGNTLILNRLTGEVIRQNSGIADGSTQITWLTEKQPYRVSLRIGREQAILVFGSTDGLPRRETPTLPTQSESSEKAR